MRLFLTGVALYLTVLPFTDAQDAGTIANQMSGKCLNVAKFNRKSPGRVVQFNCKPESKAQQWTFKPVGSKYQIIAGHSTPERQLCLGVLNNIPKEGIPLVQLICDASSPLQLFQVNKSSLNEYSLVSTTSGGPPMCIQVQNTLSSRNNVRMEQFFCDLNQAKQRWNIQAEVVANKNIDTSATPPTFRPVRNGDQLRRLVRFYTDPDYAQKAEKNKKIFGHPIGTWDVSEVTDFSKLFAGVMLFNEDLSGWNVSRATDMRGMFLQAEAFNQPLSTWDVSRVTNMRFMFKFTRAFNQPLSSWDVSSVTNMNEMFKWTDSFNQDISTWNITNVEDMSFMFFDAIAFNQDLSSWDVAMIDTTRMFDGANALVKV